MQRTCASRSVRHGARNIDPRQRYHLRHAAQRLIVACNEAERQSTDTSSDNTTTTEVVLAEQILARQESLVRNLLLLCADSHVLDTIARELTQILIDDGIVGEVGRLTLTESFRRAEERLTLRNR